MAEFIKGRALSEGSAPLACRLRRFLSLFYLRYFRQAPSGWTAPVFVPAPRKAARGRSR